MTAAAFRGECGSIPYAVTTLPSARRLGGDNRPVLGLRLRRHPGGPASALPAGASLKEALEEVTEQCERRIIGESQARNGRNKSKTARELSVTRKTLAHKIAKYGL